MKSPSRRVLIVEDDEEICASVAELLRDEGYEISEARNGRRALEGLSAAKDLPELILLDLMMPEMDGHQFRDAQRKDPRIATIPVVLMSAGTELKENARQLGAKAVLKKPFSDIDTVLDTIRRCFVSP